MDYPLVSVIMLIYNNDDFLVQAIRRVTAQTSCALELVACDDGSIDRP